MQGAKAFSDPAMLSDFVNFLRQQGEQLQARTLVCVVPKSKVAFPQVRANCAALLTQRRATGSSGRFIWSRARACQPV